MKILFILNDAPYGTEKDYNCLRLAMSIQKENAQIGLDIFLMADAVGCAVAGQKTAQGYYNLERMIKSVLNRGGRVKCCGTCMEARGFEPEDLVEGAEKSTMQELTVLTLQADKVLTF